jgi:hypothetical protein
MLLDYSEVLVGFFLKKNDPSLTEKRTSEFMGRYNVPPAA